LARLDSPEAGIDGRVIVPSRCYFKPSPSRPLDGVRVGVKDNFDIAGHKTTLNNLAWRDLYPPADKNAHCVQLLIDAGAIIVGKHKLQALIVREEPVEAVEFTDPFNPRCDGYQVPSGSSSGSAAAIGSYDWLDLSLGSDSKSSSRRFATAPTSNVLINLANGSVRKPAHYNGCHTIRPTTGIMNTEGVVGQFPCVKTAPPMVL
jgi:Asp-tRNA(Asn)/Glu-tRNA(Gln) amidotransferase A subunit family amidase